MSDCMGIRYVGLTYLSETSLAVESTIAVLAGNEVLVIIVL